MIRLEQVRKTFVGPDGPVRALQGVDLELAWGELAVVVGPSGSGKSTLLFTAGAMQRPTSGRVTLDGTDVYGLGSRGRAQLRRRRLGFVFQTFNLVPYLTCLENVVLPALLDGRDRSQAHARAKALLERVRLGHRLAHKPQALSVGERQRVAIARALINEPEVLLADEPTGNLDPERAAEVMEVLRELHDEGQTILMVTHDVSLSEQADRRIVLREGHVAEDLQLVERRRPRGAESAA